MVSQELLAWIKQAKSAGYSNAKIRETLIDKGYALPIVDEVIDPNEPIAGASRPKRKLLIPVLVIIVLLVAAGVAGVYFYSLQQVDDFLPPEEEVLFEERTVEEPPLFPSEDQDETNGSIT